MGKYEKLLLQILSGTSDANIKFEDLCNLLKKLGFEIRVRDSQSYIQKRGYSRKD
jgi:hypothetical protein